MNVGELYVIKLMWLPLLKCICWSDDEGVERYNYVGTFRLRKGDFFVVISTTARDFRGLDVIEVMTNRGHGWIERPMLTTVSKQC